MADPRLQLRRGTQSPAAAGVTTALAGEPFFDTTNDNLWVADGVSSFVHIGGASYTSRIDNFLTAHTGTVSAIVKIGDADNSAQVSLTAPTTLTASYTLTLPDNDGDANQILQTNGSGVLSWATVSSSFTVAGDTGTDSFTTGGTLTFTGTDPIDTAITNDTVTISVKTASTTVKGVASFSSDNFAVDANGVVTIKDDGVILGTETTGNYVASITNGSGITGGNGGSESAALTLALDINGLTAEAAIADADTFPFYDATASANRKATADNLRDYVLGGVSGDITINASGVATIGADAVELSVNTTGNYVASITSGNGLTGGATGEGSTPTLAVGAGTGITVNADDVQLKNAGSLSGGTVMGWNSTNTNLENSPITYTGNDVAITGDLTVTGNDIKSSGGTTAITLSGANVTIQGDLTVAGATTTLNTATLSVEDRIVELGRVDGGAPTSATTWDMAVAFNYHATTAKKSAIVWVDNAGFELAATLTESASTLNDDPQIAVGTRAALGIGSLYIGTVVTAANEVITASKTVINVTIDCGTY
jgi:hypothetical protein